MIYHLNALSVTENLQEALLNSSEEFPFAALEANLAEYANNASSWHWHDFVEFAYVEKGKLESCTPMGTLILQQGNGYFINAGILHSQHMVGDSATIRVIQFMPSLLAGSESLYRKYVLQVLKSSKIEMLELQNAEMIEELKRILILAGEEPDGYEMAVMGGLYRLWMQLFDAAQALFTKDEVTAVSHTDRVKTMLSFIHRNYSEPLTVADIAKAASVSEREAYRSFKAVLGTTPILYLLHHRIRNAARMLVETEMTITEISMACGFSSSGYMWKAFKEINGVSPRTFRRERCLQEQDKK